VEFFSLVNNVFKFTSSAESTYTDVASDAWYAPVIGITTAAGYTTGYPDGTINPEWQISRQEAAVIVSRLASLTTASTTLTFTDPTYVASWSKQAIIAANEAKIMVGYPDNSFRPMAHITRAEALVAITNCYKSILPADPVVVDPTPIDQITTSPVNLGGAADFVILSKTGISTVPNSVITGNIGVSPISATAITGFSLIADATNQFSTSSQITGKVYASTYASPTPSNLTTAISNLETAYTDAAGRAADYTELYSGDISGKTLTSGVYKWGTGVLINSDVTLHGGPNDVWIFQVAEGITQANGIKIILTGGAQAKNIFWQAAETVSIGTNAHFEGIVMSQTNISLGNGASINGRLLAQTAVTLDASTVVAP
jgi:hypothetical protein